MNRETLVIVADKFVEFTSDKHAITASHMRALLEIPHHILSGKTRLLRGQGVSDKEISEILERAETLDSYGERWDLSCLRNLPARAASELSHKRKSCNTLVSHPEQVGDSLFSLDVCIDEDCELMGDHQTGQHIQGMILIEAARQAFLAVSQAFFPHETSGKTYFVINSMTTNFIGFVFPVQMHINYWILSKDINKRRQKFNVKMEFIQGGDVQTKVEVLFTVYPDELIANKEKTLALHAFQAAVSVPEALSDRMLKFDSTVAGG